VVGAAIEENYKSIGAAAMGFGCKVIGQTPIDVNMAKQLNICSRTSASRSTTS